MNALILFASTFAVVFFLGLQSLNVNQRRYVAAAITSFGIGSANLLILKIAPGPTDAIDIAAYLAGGPLGILAAMHAHPRLVRALTRRSQTPKITARQHPTAATAATDRIPNTFNDK
jgi:hypothetical protein